MLKFLNPAEAPAPESRDNHRLKIFEATFFSFCFKLLSLISLFLAYRTMSNRLCFQRFVIGQPITDQLCQPIANFSLPRFWQILSRYFERFGRNFWEIGEMVAGEVKGWFHNWLSKQQKQPTFDIRPAGGRGKSRFKCEGKC